MSLTVFLDLAEEISVPPDGTLSRTIHRDETAKVVLFGFAPNQELSEHTASVPAIMHFLQGSGRVTIGGKTYDVGPNSWFFMPANTPHSVYATTELTMLLTMITAAKS
jgi:quercetin dioxygenase-like cupin family protein